MDKALAKQQSRRAIQAVRRALKSVEPPERSEAQWTVFANELFMKLDGDAQSSAAPRGRMRPRRAYWGLRPALAATAAALVVSVALYHDARQPARVAPARILSVSGEAAMVDQNNRAICAAESLLSCGIRPGHTIRTQAGATTMIRLDSSTGLTLLGDAELTVLASTHARRRFRLRRGEVIASVSPRTARQSFEIVTENAVCKVVGTVFSVSYDSAANETGLSVFKGAVRMVPSGDHGGGDMLLSAGRFATIAGGRSHAPRTLTESETPIQAISLLHQSLAVARDSAGGNGLVSIDSDPPNATVFLDGRLVGATPLIIQAPAGKRSVAFSLDGRRERVEDVVIEAGKTADIAASLRPPTPDVSPRRQGPARRTATRGSRNAKPAFDYATHPDYVEALLQMTVGEYRKALALLEALKDDPIISLDQRTHIMHKIAQCYRGLGDFDRALQSIEQRRRNAETAAQRAHLLWEQANLKANCLEDYSGAERDLRDYIQSWPNGAWIDQAWQKLGEVLYVQGKANAALEAYEQHVAHAQNAASLDKTFFEIARILRTDLGAYSRAAHWYDRLIEQFPDSDYIEHALFELADCYRKSGNITQARRVHARYRKRFPEGRWETLSSR